MDEKEDVKIESEKTDEPTKAESGAEESAPKPASEPAAPAPAPEVPTATAAPAPTPTPTTPAPTSAPAGVNGPLPAELHGFNWGAFFLSWIWGIGNKSYLTLLVFAMSILAFIPFINLLGGFISLGLVIWFGIKGNEWAWHNRHFASVEEFKKVQKAWTIAGIIVAAVGFVLTLVFSAMIFSFVMGSVLHNTDNSTTSDDQTNAQPYDSSYFQTREVAPNQ